MNYQQFQNKWLGKRINVDGVIWKSISDLRVKNGYYVSELGQVLSTLRTPRILTNSKHRDGYLQVCLANPNGGSISIKVHRLVANAFLSNKKELPQVNHIDEDKTNNNVSNLQWVSALENNYHSKSAFYKELRGKGIDGRATLTEEDIRDIKMFRANGIKLKDIGRVYKRSIHTISAIANGKLWSWVK